MNKVLDMKPETKNSTFVIARSPSTRLRAGSSGEAIPWKPVITGSLHHFQVSSLKSHVSCLGSALCFLLLFVSCSSSNLNESINRADEYIGIGKYDKAAKIYEGLVASNIDDKEKAVVFLRLGDLYSYSIGELDKGLENYQKSIDLNPLSESAKVAYERRTEILAKGGGAGSGAASLIEEYSKLYKFFPDPRYKLLLGEAYLANKEYQQARTELEELAWDKNFTGELKLRVFFDMGESYFLESKPRDAIRYYYAFLEEAPDANLAPEVMLKVAGCLEEMGYLGMAQKFISKAGERYPNKDVIKERLKGIKGAIPADDVE